MPQAIKFSARPPAAISVMPNPYLNLNLRWWPKRGTDIAWKTTAVGNLATPRGYLGAALMDQKIYTFGGSKPDPQTPLATVESFDIQTHHSTAVPNLQMPHGRAAAAVIKMPSGQVYVCGGGSDGETSSKTCYECLLPNGPWNARSDMLQAASCSAAAPGPDGKVYVIGGLRGDTYWKTVQRYDFGSGTWTQAHDLHMARFDAAAAVANGKIYVFGGIDALGELVTTVEEYDPATNKWTVLPHEMLTPRYDLAAVTGSNGRIYAIGGMYQCSAVDLVEEFDPVTKTWAQKTPMPTARYGAAAVATTDGRVFVLGGWKKVSNTFSAIGVIEEGTLPTYA